MLLYCIIFLLVVLYWPTSLYWNDDILWARGISNYIDWPVHFAHATKVHYQSLVEWYTHNPFVYNTRNNYPFWADVPSGLLLKTGLPFKSAFLIPSILFTVLFLYCVYQFLHRRGFNKNSIAAVLVLFLFASMPNGEGTQPQLWLNTFSPNRSLLLTFSLLLIVYGIFDRFLNSTTQENFKQKVLTFLKLTGITLLVSMTHPHTLLSIAVTATIFSFVIFKKKRSIPVEAIAWAFASLAIVFTFKYYLWGEATAGYPMFRPNWTEERFGVNPILFWPFFGGIVYLLGVGLAIYKRKYIELSIIVTLTLVHLLFQWQINEYDNIKNTLLMMFLCSSLVVQLLPAKKLLIPICLVCIVPSLKEWTEIYPISSRIEMDIAERLQNDTPKDYVAIIDSRHNHFIPMFTTIPVMAWWDFYSWTLGLQSKPETILRFEALQLPQATAFTKPLLFVVRNDGSYSPYEVEGRFKDLTGRYLQFNQEALVKLAPYQRYPGYTIYRKLPKNDQ
ncbi:hypothetical protein [Bdellovibrio sp. HCB274]|uniref:hypothetical protein n=1 Tax=Bdellovibrio sp. HCB274 TaxID=3394361 RepID=UPI0039B551D2